MLVTGGGTGLGRAAAAELRRCGAEVVICGRREEVLAATAAELEPASVAGDVREDADAERIVRAALERHGRLDALVNNAGGQYFTPAEAIEPKGWRAVTRLNVGGTERMTRLAAERAFLPGRRRHDRQRHALAAPRARGHDALERRARRGRGLHARAGARSGPTDGIAVIAVAAGHFDTASLRKYPEPVWRAAARTVPLQRLGREDEHAWLVALCCSPLGAALSGSVLTLDGARDNWFGPWPPRRAGRRRRARSRRGPRTEASRLVGVARL